MHITSLLLLIGITCVACAPTAEVSTLASSHENITAEDIQCVDSLPEQCAKELKPYFCYNDSNRRQCCHTCNKLRQQSDVCPFGNQPILKWRDGRKYTCETYVARYGSKHCQQSRKFRLQCCKSCENIKE